MTRKVLIIIIFFLVGFRLSLQAQLETAHWYFGQNAGLDFSSGTPFVDTNSTFGLSTAASIICDTAGNPLFIAGRGKIKDRNSNIMHNGIDVEGCASYLQGSLIVKKPCSDSLYCVFFTDNQHIMHSQHGYFTSSLRYNVINIKGNNGNGSLIHKNDTIRYGTTEQITAARHCNGRDIWIITRLVNTNSFISYLLTPNGVDTSYHIISNAGFIINNAVGQGSEGILKMTSDGKKILLTRHDITNSAIPSVELFSFDNSTGVVSQPISIGKDLNYLSGNYRAIFAEFSPNKKHLYVSYMGQAEHLRSRIYQYDISSNDTTLINQSATVLYDSYTCNPIDITGNPLGMQLGLDNKIYCLLANKFNLNDISNYSISRINYPDSTGIACNFVKDAIYLNGKKGGVYLPLFYSFYFYKYQKTNFHFTNNCLNYHFTAFCDTTDLDSIRWHFGDIASGINNTSALYAPLHKFSDTGSYTVKVFYHYKCRTDSVIKTINVQLPPYSFPQSFIADTLTPLCKQLSFMPVCDSASLDSLRWNFGDPASGIANTASYFNPWHTFSDTGTYNITLILYAFCRTDTVRKTVHVALPVSNFTLGTDTTLCNQDSLQLGFNFQSVLPTSYQWQNGDTTSTFWVKQPGNYRVKLNAGGCYFTDSISINYQQTPTLQLPNDTLICEDSRIYISIPQGNYNILWNDGSMLNNRSFNMAGNYTVSLSNHCGTASDNFVLETKSCNCYLYIPNAFTPTGDGLNECFKAVYNCDFEDFRLYIYNRWGQLIYETQNPADCWDGKYKNSLAEAGVYVYLLEYKSIYNSEKEVRKGRITVVR